MHNLRQLLQPAGDTKPKWAAPKPLFTLVLEQMSKDSLIKLGIAPADADVLYRQGVSPRHVSELLRTGKLREFVEYCEVEEEREAEEES